MESSGKLAGKRALVTGAGTGIGREIALEFARQGADVVLHYSHGSEGAESAAQEIQSLGRRAAILAADFNDADAALRMVDSALAFLGGMDCLVNNAGITLNRPFLKMRTEQLDTLVNVNFRTPYLLTQRIVEPMVKRGMVICNLSSIHALQGAPETLLCGREGGDRGLHPLSGRRTGFPRGEGECHRAGVDHGRESCHRYCRLRRGEHLASRRKPQCPWHAMGFPST